MKTRWLLLIAATSAALFAGTWYFFGRERPGQPPSPPQTPKTTAELLVGIWEVVESDPPLDHEILKATEEFRPDGTHIVRATLSKAGPIPPLTGAYQVNGATLRCDYPESGERPYQTWIATIEVITDDTLVVVVDGETKTRGVYKRANHH